MDRALYTWHDNQVSVGDPKVSTGNVAFEGSKEWSLKVDLNTLWSTVSGACLYCAWMLGQDYKRTKVCFGRWMKLVPKVSCEGRVGGNETSTVVLRGTAKVLSRLKPCLLQIPYMSFLRAANVLAIPDSVLSRVVISNSVHYNAQEVFTSVNFQSGEISSLWWTYFLWREQTYSVWN